MLDRMRLPCKPLANKTPDKALQRKAIYLGWSLFIAGIGFRHANWFVLALAVAILLLLYWAVILEEEKYLEHKFGEECEHYRKRVRSWV